VREPLENGAPRHYERPNQTWTCGLASEGQACPAGPTAGGKCPALAVCSPVRDGDRWRCNRSPLRGGPCDEGPAPDGECCHVYRCEPVRSLRAKRGRFLAACALATAGLLLICIYTQFRNAFISPGPLSRQHAQLTDSASANGQCSACHAAANDGPTGWMASLVVSHGAAPSQSQLCMECHVKDFSKDFARSPHNLPPEALAQITATRGGNEGASLLSRVANATFRLHPSEPACAACHHEHHGADHDLTAIDNASCQACHRERYQSFAVNHPDFGGWPYQRRTRIAFDHVAHEAKRFPDKKQPFDCKSCHVDDATHSVELLANYDHACAACHDEKLQTSMGKGVAMISLPILDVAAFRKAGVDVGAWPAAATGDFDGRMPPQMKLLLAGDLAAAEAMKKLGPNFEFSDLEADNADQLRIAAAVVEGVKKLLVDLSQNGARSVRARLQTALGRDISDAEVQSLLAGLSADTVSGAIKSWLPNANVTPSDWTSKDAAPTPQPRTQNPELSFALPGDWSRDDATFTIRYRLTSHADPVLTSWLNLIVATPKLDERPLLAAVAKEFTKTTARGQCVSCHSVEQSAADALTINWRPYDRTSAGRTFNKFDHGPHLRLPQLADCTACHALDPQANTTASYADQDPHHFVSEFQPISKQTCAACHTKTAAGDSCQSCHRYHIDEVDKWRTPHAESISQRTAELSPSEPNRVRTSNDTQPAPR
jgi:cytochrome c1